MSDKTKGILVRVLYIFMCISTSAGCIFSSSVHSSLRNLSILAPIGAVLFASAAVVGIVFLVNYLRSHGR